MKISLTVDENKQLDIELEDPSELERITIISKVFELLGVGNSLSEMVDDFVKIGEAYKKFYENVDNGNEYPDKKPLDLKLKYKENEDVLHTDKENQPDYYKSGIVQENGIDKYKCRLHCGCGNNQNIYIEGNKKRVTCPNCGKEHVVRNAKEKGFPERDSWGNYFIAGGYVGEDEDELPRIFDTEAGFN